jgi:hypothetical protein
MFEPLEDFAVEDRDLLAETDDFLRIGHERLLQAADDAAPPFEPEPDELEPDELEPDELEPDELELDPFDPEPVLVASAVFFESPLDDSVDSPDFFGVLA